MEGTSTAAVSLLGGGLGEREGLGKVRGAHMGWQGQQVGSPRV